MHSPSTLQHKWLQLSSAIGLSSLSAAAGPISR